MFFPPHKYLCFWLLLPFYIRAGWSGKKESYQPQHPPSLGLAKQPGGAISNPARKGPLQEAQRQRHLADCTWTAGLCHPCTPPVQGLQAAAHPQVGTESPQKWDLADCMAGELQVEQEPRAAAASLPVPGNEFECELKLRIPGRCWVLPSQATGDFAVGLRLPLRAEMAWWTRKPTLQHLEEKEMGELQWKTNIN